MTTDKLANLYFRRELARFCIQTLDQTDDPRRFDAIKEYQRQLASIDAKIGEIEGKPPAVTVGLKTARLFGKSSMK